MTHSLWIDGIRGSKLTGFSAYIFSRVLKSPRLTLSHVLDISKMTEYSLNLEAKLLETCRASFVQEDLKAAERHPPNAFMLLEG